MGEAIVTLLGQRAREGARDECGSVAQAEPSEAGASGLAEELYGFLFSNVCGRRPTTGRDLEFCRIWSVCALDECRGCVTYREWLYVKPTRDLCSIV